MQAQRIKDADRGQTSILLVEINNFEDNFVVLKMKHSLEENN